MRLQLRATAPPAGGPVPSIAPILARVTPAVVDISVKARSAAESNPLLQDPFFRRFFNIPDEPHAEHSAGSGVIVDADRGLVVTNNHVIKGAEEIQLRLKDRRVLKARLVGTDPGTDIALLRIPAERLSSGRRGCAHIRGPSSRGSENTPVTSASIRSISHRAWRAPGRPAESISRPIPTS